MREINFIAIHCTAGSQKQTVESILKFWREVNGWKKPGYHHLIKPGGEVVDLLPIEQVSNGVQGYNSQTINIAYIGGVDKNGKAVDNRTEEQIISMIALLRKYHKMFPKAKIQGHRDFWGVKKACPSFDVCEWVKHIAFEET